MAVSDAERGAGRKRDAEPSRRLTREGARRPAKPKAEGANAALEAPADRRRIGMMDETAWRVDRGGRQKSGNPQQRRNWASACLPGVAVLWDDR